MSFFSFKEQDFKGLEKLFWPTKEVVEFVITDFTEKRDTGDLIVSTKVLSERHKGEAYKHFISNRDNEITQKIRLQFALAFWSKEALMSGDFNPAKLINRKFSAIAGQVKEYNGQQYQNFGAFKDLGEYSTAADGGDLVDADGNPQF